MLGEDKDLKRKVDHLSQKVETLERKCDERDRQIEKMKRRLEELAQAYYKQQYKQQDHLIKQELSHGLANDSPQGKSPVRPFVPAPGSRAPSSALSLQQDSVGHPAGLPVRNSDPFPVYDGAGTGWTAATRSRRQSQQSTYWQAQAPAPPQRTTAKAAPGNVRDFVTRYNALPSGGGIADRDARKTFLQEFSIQGFSCANYEERMSNPKVAPRYEEAEVMRADYWAKQVQSDLYAVVPSAKLTYDSAHHAAGGMMEAFDSNFETGHTYRQIRVEEPAYFLKRDGRWSVRKKGRLRLSE